MYAKADQRTDGVALSILEVPGHFTQACAKELAAPRNPPLSASLIEFYLVVVQQDQVRVRRVRAPYVLYISWPRASPSAWLALGQ